LRSEQLDLQGQHSAAIDSLVAGVHRRDVEAITRLGKRLLIGDRAPHLPRDGLRFLREAREQGSAEAPARLSVCLAIGMDGSCDLDAARGALADAAERGWKDAQAQVQLLAGARSESARETSEVGPNQWRALANRIDLAAWTTVPAAAEVNQDPLIRSFPSLVAPEVCRWIIDRARGRLTRALVYDAVSRQTTTHSTRSNSAAVFNLLETDMVCVLAQTLMAASVGLPFRNLEAMTVLHYAVGEQISEHFDFVDPNVPNYEQQVRERGQRVVTFLIYLNDDYAGGETEFPRLGVSHRGRGGEGMFFVNAFASGAPDVRTLHAGRPITRGEKWIVSQFIKNQPAF